MADQETKFWPDVSQSRSLKFYDAWLPERLAEGYEHPCLGNQSLAFADAFAEHENAALRTRLAEVEKERDAALSYLISCPWCGEQMEKRPISYQIPHLIRHGDERQSRVIALEEAATSALIPIAALVISGECVNAPTALSEQVKVGILEAHDKLLAVLTPASPKEG